MVLAPVEFCPMLIVPVPSASIERFSLEPDETTERATPAAAAAPLTFRPVATEAVLASTTRTGVVAPLAPPASAEAEADVTVCAALPSVEEKLPAAAESVPVKVGLAESAMLPGPGALFGSVT